MSLSETVNEMIEERKKKAEIQSLILETMGEGFNDSRFHSVSKLNKMEKCLMNLTLKDVENTNKAMSEEIKNLINETYQRFNTILRNHNEEEV